METINLKNIKHNFTCPVTKTNIFMGSDGETIINTDEGVYLKHYENQGKRQIVLSIGRKRKTHLVHRIVAGIYLPTPEDNDIICHLDGNNSNNKASNLKWMSYSENMKHRRMMKFPLLTVPLTIPQKKQVFRMIAERTSRLDITCELGISTCSLDVAAKELNKKMYSLKHGREVPYWFSSLVEDLTSEGYTIELISKYLQLAKYKQKPKGVSISEEHIQEVEEELVKLMEQREQLNSTHSTRTAFS